jgi:copper resistance protein B
VSRAAVAMLAVALGLAGAQARAQDAVDHSKMDHSRMGHAMPAPPAPTEPPPSVEPDAPAAQARDPHAEHAAHAVSAAPNEPSQAATLPRTPIPVPTDADRAAARLPPGGHAAHGDSVHTFVGIDRLEAWRSDASQGAAWEVQGWSGRDIHKLRFRSEGDSEDGALGHAELDLLYSRAVSPWWDAVVGLHHESQPTSHQALAIGVLGLAPYKIETQAMLYLGEGGDASLRVELEYDTLLSNRWILQSLVELRAESRADADRHVGAGLARIEAGLRLRFEAHRQFAPYVGIVREQAFGGTADLLRAEGERAGEWRWVLGVRTWF